MVGIASWYGPGFDGRRTASGEVYHQEDLTAASNIFPIGTRLLVADLENGRVVEVRVNDRGPFRKHRKIDLSRGAARALGMIRHGTAPVRMYVLAVPAGQGPTPARSRYFVQVGAFSRPYDAERLRDELLPYYPDVRVDPAGFGSYRYYRVRMGAFETRAQAQARADGTARLGLPVIIVSR